MDHEGKSNGNGLQDWIVIIGCVVVGSKIRTQTGWVMAFKKTTANRNAVACGFGLAPRNCLEKVERLFGAGKDEFRSMDSAARMGLGCQRIRVPD